MNLNILSKNRNKIYGFAFLTILAFHYAMDLTKEYQVGSFQFNLCMNYYKYICSGGVDMFAFLSGMGLYYSLSKQIIDKKVDLVSFYIKRIERLIIPYLLVAVPFWSFRDLYVKGQPIKKVFIDLFFVSFVRKGTTTLWYVLFCITIYLVAPLVIWAFCSKLRPLWFILFFAGTVSIMPFFYYYNNDFYNDTFIMLGRYPVFILGCFFGKYIKEGKKIWPILYGLLFGASLYGMNLVYAKTFPIYFTWFMLSIWSLVWMLLLAYVLDWIDIKPLSFIGKILASLGGISLELYMCHVTIRHLYTALACSILHNKVLFIGSIVLTFAAAYLVSWITDALLKLKKSKKNINK